MPDQVQPVPDYVHQAMAELAKAEALKHAAEQSVFEAQAAEIITRHRKGELDREREEYKYAQEQADDEHNRVYRLQGGIDSASVKTTINKLWTWSRQDPGCDIDLVFTSPGGSVIDGMALYDTIIELRSLGHHIRTVTRGYAASMAGILLQAGSERQMGAEAWLLIHEASFGAVGSYGDIEDIYDWVTRIQDRILDIFAERSAACNPEKPLSKKQIKDRWHRKDWWLSSQQALEHGFIDAIQ